MYSRGSWLVTGGCFTTVGNVSAIRIAQLSEDRTTWRPLGGVSFPHGCALLVVDNIV
jgi:hypothetical protein